MRIQVNSPNNGLESDFRKRCALSSAPQPSRYAKNHPGVHGIENGL